MKANRWQAICPWLDDFLAWGLESGEYRLWSGTCIWNCETAASERKMAAVCTYASVEYRCDPTTDGIRMALMEYWPTIEPRLP